MIVGPDHGALSHQSVSISKQRWGSLGFENRIFTPTSDPPEFDAVFPKPKAHFVDFRSALGLRRAA